MRSKNDKIKKWEIFKKRGWNNNDRNEKKFKKGVEIKKRKEIRKNGKIFEIFENPNRRQAFLFTNEFNFNLAFKL